MDKQSNDTLFLIFQVILSINMTLSVIVSALIAVGYTFFGGMYAVAFTDVVQLFCIFIGLFLTLPFALTSDEVTPIGQTTHLWGGTVEGEWGRFTNVYFHEPLKNYYNFVKDSR